MCGIPGVDAGINGVMLGDIFGRNAGDIVAEFVPCRFLPGRKFVLDSDRFSISGESTDGIIADVLGVLEALIFADLADIVGVSWLSGLLVVSTADNNGRVADSGSMMSSITSSPSSRALIGTPFADALLLGMRINVAGVAGSPVSVVDNCANTFGDLEEGRGIAGGGIRLSDSGSGDTELSLLVGALPDEDAISLPQFFDS